MLQFRRDAEMKRKNGPRAGVTLIEMLVVVVIIAVLAAVIGPRLLNQGDKARTVAARQQLENFGLALGQYHLDTGGYPSTEQGLQALVTQPSNDPHPTRWYQLFRELPKDPWGSDYIYRNPGQKNSGGYDLYSAGPDRQADTGDDDWGGG